MTAYLIAWVTVAVIASFAALALVVGLEIRDYRRPAAMPTPEPLIPAQRGPSAAVVIHALDADAFDEFLRELIVTPHIEDVLR